MIATPQQLADPMDRFRGIRDRFATGGTATGVIIVVGALIAAVLAIYLAMAWVQRRRKREVCCPKRLFDDLLVKLSLTVTQRDLLRRMARELGLEHPTVLLLSPGIYHLHVNKWMTSAQNVNIETRKHLDRLAEALFAGTGQATN